MNHIPGEVDLPHEIIRPRPVRAPSRLAQAALLLVGATALFLFVMQLTAPNPNGLVNGHGAAFDGHNPVVHRVGG